MFPDPKVADENGIVCVGGELSTEVLHAAYAQGIFPWPHEGFPLLWFCPWNRGVLEIKNLHLPRSFLKQVRKANWTLSVDRDFDAVIKNCKLAVRKGQEGTWIDSQIYRSYCKFHREGFAHSFEIRDGGNLVGGAYGVYVEGVMSAESMFFIESGASKAALAALAATMLAAKMQWIDIQMVTPLTAAFGGEEWSQQKFLDRHRAASSDQRIDFGLFDGRPLAEIIDFIKLNV